ncbi:MAG TPA: helix-turn-helix domain-containing protein [Thermoleophilaceae bacterium]
MTKAIDITDPMVAKAYAHPLRIEILGLLDNRVASPRQLATELGTGLSATSYHVRQLAAVKLIRLVRRRQVRGAIEHLYTANVRPTITDTGWARLPDVVKHAYLGGKIAQIGKEVAAAAEQGGFDHEDMHLTRTSLRLTPDAWAAAAGILTRALKEIDALAAEDAGRDDEKSEANERHAVAVMMLFEAASPRSFGPSPGTSDATDDFEDVALLDQGLS